MKRAEEMKALRGESVETLRGKVLEMKEELMKLRFRHATGQLEQSARLTTLRRNIARAMTLITNSGSSPAKSAK